MVNADSPTQARPERRERSRDATEVGTAPAFAGAKLNPFGDLHALQHMSARYARSLRGVFEPLLRRATRSWAEPVSVQLFSDYLAEREEGLTAWLPLKLKPDGGQAFMVVDGRFVLELLDLFFGGPGDVPSHLPSEFSASAEAMVSRLADMLMPSLVTAWEPLVRIGFEPGTIETNPSMLSTIDGEDAMVITRFGVSPGEAKPAFIDLIYPVAALKPYGTQLTTKVHGRSAEPDPKWRNGITRAAMGVTFEVRSVLAEPVMSLGRLLELKEGDIIPIDIGQNVPVMVERNRLGTGTVGTANGHAAIRIQQIETFDEEEMQ